jgi:hypothetical protein
MIFVKLIEEIHQIKNHIEVVATVKTEDGEEYLGITEFILQSGQILPEDEDELCYFLEDMQLTWDLYIPNFNDEPIAA